MGNEGRSGGPQGSKSTRSSEEPFRCLLSNLVTRKFVEETEKQISKQHDFGGFRSIGEVDSAVA